MKKLFSLLLLLLIFLTTFSIIASIADVPTKEDENYWRELIQEKKKEISNIKKMSELPLKSLNDKVAEISRFRETSELKFDQLNLRLLTEVFTPYSFRATTKESCFVIEEFITQHTEANKLLNILSSYASIFEKVKMSINILLGKEIPADVKNSLGEMYSDVVYIGDRIVKIQDKLKAEIVIFDKDIKTVDTELLKFKDIVMKYMIQWYIMPSKDMYDPNAWKIIGAIYKDLFYSLYRNVLRGIPDFQNEWKGLVNSFSGGIFSFLLGWFLLHRFFKKEEAKRRMFIRALFWAAAGSILFIYTKLINFYPRIDFNYFLIAIFFVTSMVYLSWGFRCKEYVSERKSPFAPMLWLFIYGMILQFMDIYYPLLSVLWLLGIIISIPFLKRQIRMDYVVFEKNLLIISYVLYICCALIVLVGLTHLSILVILSWFIMCLSVQLGLNVNASGRKIIEHFAVGSHSLFKIIIIGIIAPVVWLVMIMFLYLWVVWQTLGSELLVIDFALIRIMG